MEVLYHHFVFDTSAMSAFGTGEPSMPTIYVNRNGVAFLEHTRKSWSAPRLRHIDRIETRRLAQKYGLTGILEILDSKTCGCW